MTLFRLLKNHLHLHAQIVIKPIIYPRTTDPVYRVDSGSSVTNDTITFFSATVAGHPDHIFVSAADNCIALKGDTIKLTDGSIVMSCDNGGVSKLHPELILFHILQQVQITILLLSHDCYSWRGCRCLYPDQLSLMIMLLYSLVLVVAHTLILGINPASGRWLTGLDADDTTFKVQVLDTIPSQILVYMYSSAVPNGTKKKKDWAYDRLIPIKSVGYTSHAVTNATYDPSTGTSSNS